MRTRGRCKRAMAGSLNCKNETFTKSALSRKHLKKQLVCRVCIRERLSRTRIIVGVM